MGSWCSGGNQTTQTTGPNAGGLAALQNANLWLGRVDPSQAPLLNVNPANAGQLGAYNYFNSLAANNPFDPYAARATDLFNQSVTRPDIEGYLNPYRDAAVEAMKKYNFDLATRQAMGASAQAAGGVGAARSGITAANLAKSQADATTSAMANFYNSAAQQAFQQRANQAGAAYGLGALGSQQLAGQLGIGGAMMQGANNLYQVQQAPNQAAYNQQLMAFQTPFSLASAYGGLAPAYGGTQTTIYPQQSPWGQILGLGVAGLGAFMNPGGAFAGALGGLGRGMGNAGFQAMTGGQGFMGSGQNWYGQARGGRIKNAALGGSMFTGGVGSGLPMMGGVGYSRRSMLGRGIPQGIPQGGLPIMTPPQAAGMPTPTMGGDLTSAMGIPPSPAITPNMGIPPTAPPQMAAPPPTGTAVLNPGAPLKSLVTGQPGTPFNTNTGTMVDPTNIGGGSGLPSSLGMGSGLPSGAMDTGALGLPQSQFTGSNFINPFRAARGGVVGFQDGGTPFDDDPEALSQYGRDVLRDAFAAKGQEPPPVANRNLTGPGKGIISWTKEGDPDSVFEAIQNKKINRADLSGLPPPITNGVDNNIPPSALSYADEGGGGDDRGGGTSPTSLPPPLAQGQIPTGRAGLPSLPNIGGDLSSRMAASPAMALIAAGARMMQGPRRDTRGLLEGTNPLGQFLATMGHGAETGVSTLEQQREQARKDELAKYQAAMQQVPYWQMTANQREEFAIKQRELALKEATPVPFGRNIWGQPVYGIRDPKSGTMIDVSTGKPVDISQLQEASEESLRTMAKQIANYKMAPLSPYKMGTQVGAQLTKMMMEENPKYDAKNYVAALASKKDFASGMGGRTVTAFNVAMDHLDLTKELVDNLNNENPQIVNRVVNAFKQQFGETVPVTFDAIKTIVGAEVAKAVIGSQNALQDREELRVALSRANTSGQLSDVIEKYQRLMAGQLNGQKQRYKSQTMANDFEDMLTDKSRGIFVKFMGKPSEAKSEAKPSETLTSPPVNAPVTKRVKQGGHTYELQPDGSYKAID